MGRDDWKWGWGVMKTLNKAMSVYEDNPDEAIRMVTDWLDQAKLDLNNSPRNVEYSYNSGHGDTVVKYGDISQDVYKARQLELVRIERIYTIITGLGG